ncbi:MAG: lipocalin-like domain-containing protein [Gemmatimonadota bacterium]
MRKLTVSVGVLLIAGLAAGHRPAPTSLQGPLEGAWQSVGQPGLVTFTEGHYSWMSVAESRELFGDPSNPTDAEQLAACSGLTANSGTYEVSDSTVRLRILVAKHPNAMAMKQVATFAYSIKADTLKVNFGGPAKYTFVRLD